jgi:tetratricopeptide (TPR) repeat protein
LATTGAIGLAAYLILLVSFAALGWKAYRKLGSSDPDTAVLALALVAGLISLSISNFFGFSTVMVTVLLFLYPAFILVLQQPKSVAEKTETDAEGKVSIDSASGFGLVMVWLVVLYCLVAVHSIWRADHLYYQAKQLNQQQQYFESVPLLEKAISLSSREALFYQELGYTYAQLAVLLAINEENESAAQLVDLAEKTSQQALRLNPVHLNFHKALARTYIVLAQITPEALAKAKLTLDQAQLLAPTDAKITYNRSLIALDLGEVDQAEQLMLKAIEMKPDYEPVYLRLAQTYAEQGRFDEALEQYRLILDTIAPHKTEIQEIINQLEQQAATASAQP